MSPVCFVLITTSGQRWELMATSLAQAIAAAEELAGEKVERWERQGLW